MTSRLQKTGALFCDWIMVTLVALGSVLCLASSFSLPVQREMLLITAAAVLVFCMLFRLRYGGLAALGVLLGLLAAAYFFRRELLDSAMTLINILRASYAEAYDSFNRLPILQPVTQPGTGPVLLALALLMAYLHSCFVSWKGHPVWMALPMLMVVFPCFVRTDTPPSLLPLCACIFPLLVLSLTHAARKKSDRDSLLSGLWAAPLAAAILAAMLVFIPRETYSPPVRWDGMTNTLTQTAERLGFASNGESGFSAKPVSASQEAVDLSELRGQSTSPSEVMTVTTDAGGTLYLRQYAYDVFDGLNWSAPADLTADERNLLPRLGAEPEHTLEIDMRTSEDALYLPYDTAVLDGGWSAQADAYVENTDNLSTYTVGYVTHDPQALPQLTQEHAGPRLVFGLSYAAVLQTCLSLPEQTRAGIDDWIDRTVPDLRSASDEAEKAAMVARAIRGVAVYSLQPDTCPEGEDYITWFLNDAETGYCMHYASAGAAVLRALDVPARLVVGYRVSVSPDNPVAVLLRDSHAWVEYYEPNGGWTPLEVTPGVDPIETALHNQNESKPAPEPEQPEEPEEPEPEEPEPEKPEPEEPEPEEPEPEKDHDNPEREPEQNEEEEKIASPWLWLLLLPALAGALIARRYACRALRRRKLERMEDTQRALTLWHRTLRLCRISGKTPEEEARCAADHAFFSREGASPGDVRTLEAACCAAEAAVGDLPLVQRLWIRYGLALI